MGKYIQKGKIKAEISVMEVSHHNQSPSSLGVRTRAKAKTLALQRLQNAKSKSKSSPCSSASSSSSKSSSCYLQLRSRRLVKCFGSKTQKIYSPRNGPNPSPKAKEKEELEKDLAIEVSFGENVVDVEGNRSRNSRESTPCSLIRRDSESLGTPGSTNRPTTSTTATNRVIESSSRRNIPTSREMEEFFAVPEQQQHRAFAEKYNFDPAKDSPLPGRYEWVKLKN